MEKDELQAQVEKYKELKENKKPGQIICSFSSNCNSGEYCMCWRCRTDKGKEADIYTEKIAEVIKLIDRFSLDSSAWCVRKTHEEKARTINFAIDTLKMRIDDLEKL